MSSLQGHSPGLKKFNYVWTINKFSTFHNLSGKIFESPLFPEETANNVPKWSVCISRDAAVSYGNSVNYSFRVVSHGGPKVCASLQLSLLGHTGQIFSTSRSHNCTLSLEEPTSSKNLISMSSNTISSFQGPLIIQCELSVIVPEEKRIQEFVFDSKNWTDIITLVVGGQELKAHKGILTSNSEVFAAMFEHKMEEQQLNRISITDIKHEVLVEMLGYMYTGISPNLGNMAEDLIAVADKYALESLKKMCVESLQLHISIDTAVNTLVLADRYKEQQLKSQVIDFIATNAADVMKTEGWNYLTTTTHVHLVEEAFAKLHENYNRILSHHVDFHKQCHISDFNK